MPWLPRTTHLIAAGAMALAAVQTTPATPTFTLTLPAGAESPETYFSLFLTGSFGGYGTGGYVKTAHEGIKRSGPNDYVFDTSNDKGQPATALKAVIYAPTYGFAVLDVPALAGHPTRAETAPPKPARGRILLAGQIIWPADAPLSHVTVRVWYAADWLCTFYRLIDCMEWSFPIATVPLGPNSHFAAEVPDFGADPALQRFQSKGMYRFDGLTKRGRYELDVPGFPDRALPAGPSQESLVLTAIKRGSP